MVIAGLGAACRAPGQKDQGEKLHPPKLKTFQSANEAQFVFFQYTVNCSSFWENIVAFLFEVILLVVTLWQVGLRRSLKTLGVQKGRGRARA